MAYRAWRGAIEVSGFPVHLSLYTRVQGAKGQSFRQLSPAGNPIRQQLVDSLTDEVVERADLQKGYEVSKGEYTVMTPEALEIIDSGVKTEVAPAIQFAPVTSIDWHLATGSYAVRPDDKVPGSDTALNIVWNGLRANGLAYVAQVSLRGGPDSILAIRADDDGMWASLIPFADELYDVPEATFTVDERAENTIAQVVAASDLLGDFDHAAYASEYKARRQSAIESVLSGDQPVKPTEQPPQMMPDLLAALEGSLAATKPKAKKAKAKVKA